MFEQFLIPIWVHCVRGASVIDSMLCYYTPSWEALTSVTEALKWGQTPADSTWGHTSISGPPDNRCQYLDVREMQPEPIPVWGDVDNPWAPSDNGCQSSRGNQLISLDSQEEVPPVFLFLEPKHNSGQLRGEVWQVFLVWCHEGNKKREEKKTPAQWQSHLSHATSAGNQDYPAKKTMVFKWQPQEEYDGFHLCICIMKNDIPSVWREYSSTTRMYDSFHNEWDLCDALDPTSIPDGDWKDEFFTSPTLFAPPAPPTLPPAPPQPPSQASFLQDID
ncbi:uncharacterized protein BJ212DRAFT_1490603 [Suillus subaureus]|uniref:Uncharacterized protein n=1 Tax=Suillus subaureus TaxID=48587 RepID=A0A9P7AMQ2_9AGAM|nr:uncharacterized protein BJ212DRAFT_1490603 [Suillus subaureus]KAG1792716.1 hypothetical protein BJ212DRAFT_1490603 [Suillus subaureus]